jgi:hypothetical protein
MEMEVGMITQGPGAEHLGDIEFEDEIVLSDSCIITPDSLSMRVRGGGLGSDAWVARITGPHATFGFEREFVDADRDLSRSGRSGTITWALDNKDGVYEYRSVCTTSRYTASGFFLIENGKVASLGNRKAGVAKWAGAQVVNA